MWHTEGRVWRLRTTLRKSLVKFQLIEPMKLQNAQLEVFGHMNVLILAFIARDRVSEKAAMANQTVLDTIVWAGSQLGYELRVRQKEVVLSFVKGRDVFVSLPTESGKAGAIQCFRVPMIIWDGALNQAQLSLLWVPLWLWWRTRFPALPRRECLLYTLEKLQTARTR